MQRGWMRTRTGPWHREAQTHAGPPTHWAQCGRAMEAHERTETRPTENMCRCCDHNA